MNLIGDHTDYMGGVVLPMAIDLCTTIEATVDGDRVRLHSDSEPEPADFALPVEDLQGLEPPWSRYVAAVAKELEATVGLEGTISSTVPVGAGLSSSAALEVASALALGAQQGAVELALLTQRAEHLAVGVPSGIMDQLSICIGRRGHASLIDCGTLEFEHVRIPPGVAVWVVHSGRSRRLESSAYGERRRSAEDAARIVGPLPAADPTDIEALSDPLLRRRARHVNSECERVHRFVEALGEGDLGTAGAQMYASHRSLRDDYEVSTRALDALVQQLSGIEGVYGARLTGAGFGGCVVALTDAEVTLDGWRVTPADGTSFEVLDD